MEYFLLSKFSQTECSCFRISLSDPPGTYCMTCGMGDFVDRAIRNFFVNLGTFCATYTVPVIICGLAIAAALCVGLMFIEVVTDPIELWAAPTSRSRVEKDYFDSHFV